MFVKIKKVLTSRNLTLSVILIFVSTYLNLFIGSIINDLYPQRQPIYDLMFDVLPLVPQAQYITDIAVIVSGVLIFVYFVKYELKYLPYALMAFGVFYLFRSGLVALNPIGGYHGNEATFGLTSIKPYGAFPSGHVGFASVAYMLSDGALSKKVNIILYVLVVVEIVSLLLARGHYGTDVVGGLLLAYFVIFEIKKFKERLTL